MHRDIPMVRRALRLTRRVLVDTCFLSKESVWVRRVDRSPKDRRRKSSKTGVFVDDKAILIALSFRYGGLPNTTNVSTIQNAHSDFGFTLQWR